MVVAWHPPESISSSFYPQQANNTRNAVLGLAYCTSHVKPYIDQSRMCRHTTPALFCEFSTPSLSRKRIGGYHWQVEVKQRDHASLRNEVSTITLHVEQKEEKERLTRERVDALEVVSFILLWVGLGNARHCCDANSPTKRGNKPHLPPSRWGTGVLTRYIQRASRARSKN